MENISKNISYKEATRSETAIKKGIDNTPNEKQLANIKDLAENVFEPLREWVGGPVRINSLFRSVETNTSVGGSSTSQHCALRGAAIDVDDTYGHKTNAEMFDYILENLPFDQLLWEFGDAVNPDWVHVSFVKGHNRGQVLRVVRENGKTKYQTYS